MLQGCHGFLAFGEIEWLGFVRIYLKGILEAGHPSLCHLVLWFRLSCPHTDLYLTRLTVIQMQDCGPLKLIARFYLLVAYEVCFA